jgi:AAA15 family ATPase/GTPase
MLSNKSVKNFRNFKEWFDFDLSTDRDYQFNIEAISELNKTVKHSIVYGQNGAGKSNLGLAILDLTCHLSDNSFLPSLQSNYLNANSDPTSIAEFKYCFKFDGVVVEYKYGKSDHITTVYEELIIDNEACISLDRRNGNTAIFNLKGTENLKADLSNSVISAVKYLNSNAVLDSNKINGTFIKFIEFVNSMVFFRTLTGRADFSGQSIDSKRLSQTIIKAGKVPDFQNFLNEAGIDCKLVVSGRANEEIIEFKFDKKPMEFSLVASTGTMSLGIFYYWWLKLESGLLKFAYIDEFDAYYHFSLSKLIVKKLSAINCQCVLTTHNTGIISNNLLRPDCYFQIDHKKIAPLYQLSDRELRKAHNLEKMYRSGAFNE